MSRDIRECPKGVTSTRTGLVVGINGPSCQECEWYERWNQLTDWEGCKDFEGLPKGRLRTLIKYESRTGILQTPCPVPSKDPEVMVGSGVCTACAHNAGEVGPEDSRGVSRGVICTAASPKPRGAPHDQPEQFSIRQIYQDFSVMQDVDVEVFTWEALTEAERSWLTTWVEFRQANSQLSYEELYEAFVAQYSRLSIIGFLEFPTWCSLSEPERRRLSVLWGLVDVGITRRTALIKSEESN